MCVYTDGPTCVQVHTYVQEDSACPTPTRSTYISYFFTRVFPTSLCVCIICIYTQMHIHIHIYTCKCHMHNYVYIYACIMYGDSVTMTMLSW